MITYYRPNLSSDNDEIGIHFLSDDSGYYIALVKISSVYANIWKVLFNSLANIQCQEFANINNFFYGTLMIDNNQLFIIGSEISSPYSNYFLKFTFGNTTTDWTNKMSWVLGTWDTFISESILSSDSTSIYTFFTFGQSTSYYTYYAKFNFTNGAVIGTRYKSSISWSVGKSASTGNYIFLLAYCSNNWYFMIFDTLTTTFTNMVTNSTIDLKDVKIDQPSGR